MIAAALFEPFSYGFMQRALLGCLALSVAGPPLGVFLVLRRMSLMTDPLQHGILPGLAIGAMIAGLSPSAMMVGGLLAGLIVVAASGGLGRARGAHEDSALAGSYLIALALGVALISLQRNVDLTHLLFGNILAVDNAALELMVGVATVAMLGLAVIWRPLILESFDTEMLELMGGRGRRWHFAFLALVVLVVVVGFTAIGTLMSVGLMMLPAVAARHWSASLAGQMVASVIAAILASVSGLLISFHSDIPTGAAIVLAAGVGWLISVAINRWRMSTIQLNLSA